MSKVYSKEVWYEEKLEQIREMLLVVMSSAVEKIIFVDSFSVTSE
jgi:hypothetical protein